MTKTRSRLPLALLAALLFEGCTSLGLTAANIPAAFGDYHRDYDLAYGKADRQKLDVYVPTGSATHRHPVVVFFYGGGWTHGAKEQYRFVAAALAARGFVVVVPNYRLYPEVRFPLFVDDAALAVRWVHDNVASFGGDPARLVLLGHSAGAHIAAMLTFDERYLQRAGVDPDLIRGFIGLAGPYDFLPIIDPVVQQVFASLEDPKESQPIHYVDGTEVPTLLMHGDADQRVSPTNTEHLAARIRERGGCVIEREFPGMSHSGILAALSVYFRGRKPVLDEISRFVEKVAPE
ncbi:MAG: alpha/beta hydrolase [Gammaproteobacteria bacterium]